LRSVARWLPLSINECRDEEWKDKTRKQNLQVHAYVYGVRARVKIWFLLGMYSKQSNSVQTSGSVPGVSNSALWGTQDAPDNSQPLAVWHASWQIRALWLDWLLWAHQNCDVLITAFYIKKTKTRGWVTCSYLFLNTRNLYFKVKK
jgi:hypothetical protein